MVISRAAELSNCCSSGYENPREIGQSSYDSLLQSSVLRFSRNLSEVLPLLTGDCVLVLPVLVRAEQDGGFQKFSKEFWCDAVV